VRKVITMRVAPHTVDRRQIDAPTPIDEYMCCENATLAPRQISLLAHRQGRARHAPCRESSGGSAQQGVVQGFTWRCTDAVRSESCPTQSFAVADVLHGRHIRADVALDDSAAGMVLAPASARAGGGFHPEGGLPGASGRRPPRWRESRGDRSTRVGSTAERTECRRWQTATGPDNPRLTLTKELF
jgi:hypothetical protein